MKMIAKTFTLIIICLFFVSSAFANKSITTIKQFKWGLKLNTVMPCAKTMEGVCAHINQGEKFSCLLNVITQFKECKQTMAFMQATSGMILQVKTYMDENLYVIKARVFKDGKSMIRYFIVNKYGELIALSSGISLRHVANYRSLHRLYPKLTVWQSAEAFPKMHTLDTGNTQLIFKQALNNGCTGCAQIGVANVAYTFDKTGKLIQVQLLKLTPTQQTMQKAE